MGRLSGKRALVTAAGQGIGRASAIAMAREGCAVTATDVNPAGLASLDGLKTRVLDVRDPLSIASALDAVGAPDILFNCAGFVAPGTILDCDEDQWAFSVDLTLISTSPTVVRTWRQTASFGNSNRFAVGTGLVGTFKSTNGGVTTTRAVTFKVHP